MPLTSDGDLQGVHLVPTGYRQNQIKFVMGYNTVRKCFYSEISRQDIRYCAIITRRGGWEIGIIRLKIKSHPSLIKQNINFNLPSPADNIKVNPTPLLPPPPPSIGSLIPNLRVGYLSQAQKVLQMTLQMTKTIELLTYLHSSIYCY